MLLMHIIRTNNNYKSSIIYGARERKVIYAAVLEEIIVLLL